MPQKIKKAFDRLVAVLPAPARARVLFVYWWLKRGRVRKGSVASRGLVRATIEHNSFGTYCVPEESKWRPAARKIRLGHVYESSTLSFIESRRPSGDVVHAGAYFGDFLPALSQFCESGEIVWAFEPNPTNFSCASATIALNRLDNVRLFESGLGSSHSTGLLVTTDQAGVSLGGASSVSVDENSPGTGVEISIVRLDDVVSEDRVVGLLQLDVEGFEQYALEGALQLISRCRPMLIIEVNPGDNFVDSGWFSMNIRSLGYRETANLHGNRVFEV